MFKRRLIALVLIGVFAALGTDSASANTSATKLPVFETSDSQLSGDQSSIVVLPDGTRVALHNDWRTARFYSSVLSADSKTVATATIFANGNTLGQNPTRFDWKLSKEGKLFVLFTTWVTNNGVPTVGLKIRSTFDGQNWSDPISVVPDYQDDTGCNPRNQVCGYVQPRLVQNSSGALLAVAARATTIMKANFVSATSTNGVNWSAPSVSQASVALPIEIGAVNNINSGTNLFGVTATDTDFVLIHYYYIPGATPFKVGDYGYKTMSMPFKSLGKWLSVKVVSLVRGTDVANRAVTTLGPYLVYTPNKLQALWFERPTNSSNTVLRQSIYNNSTGEWSSPKKLYQCTNCDISRCTTADRNATIVTGSSILLPFVETQGALDFQLSVKFLTITDGVLSPSGATDVVAGEPRSTEVEFFGAHQSPDGTLALVVQRNLAVELVEFSSDRKSKAITTVGYLGSNRLSYGLGRVVHSALATDGNITMMFHHYPETPEPLNTTFNYYKVNRVLPPALKGELSVSGTPKVGATLKTSTVSFTANVSPSAMVTKWYRCSKPIKLAPKAKPSECVAIPNALVKSYKLTSKDKGKYLIASVSSFNSGGTTIVFSASSAVVK
jgi:hypothetical protein